MGLTKFVLKRPVTAVLAILSLVVFGIQSLLVSRQELMPEMDLPFRAVMIAYPGASPEDIDELVTREVEEAVGSLSGVKAIMSYSLENASVVQIQYDYGTNMDISYDEMKKQIDQLIATTLPEECETPVIMEASMTGEASMYLSVNNPNQPDLYNYVNNVVVPEFEKISTVAEVNVSGGQKDYVRVELIPEKLEQYHLTMSGLVTGISSAGFTYPLGETVVGGQKLAVSAGTEYDTIDLLRQIPIPLAGGNTIYLEDVANVYATLDDAAGIARYDGRDTISVDISKQQSATAVEVSRSVQRTLDRLRASDPNLEAIVVYDQADDIQSSLKSVYQTMIMAVAISMVIIFLFFGELKASLIVGTSIPISILGALVCMWAMGFSLNVITLSSLVLGVGMMVDNSIVVLESCFRATESKGFVGYREAALEGSGIVLQSIIGGTATTCVVFLPIAFLAGLTGQLFQPLGFTVVFCMLASLVSAVSVVPLCYCYYHPKERQNAPVGGIVRAMQGGYRVMIKSFLRHKALVMITSVLLLAVSIFLATRLRMELMGSDDTGTITVSIATRPGQSLEQVDAILQQAEDMVKDDPDVDSYMLTYGGSGLSLNSNARLEAYLKEDRQRDTDVVAKEWRPILGRIPGADVTVTAASSMSMMGGTSSDVEYILQSTQYEALKAAADGIADELIGREDVTSIHTTLENAAPVVKLEIDAVKANAENITPIQIASAVRDMVSGKEATKIDVDGESVSVMVEFPKDQYDTIDKLQGIVLPNNSGGSVALTDVAEIVFRDTPSAIERYDKQYRVTITGDVYTDDPREVDALDQKIYDEVVSKYMDATITRAQNIMDEMMAEEFSALFRAIGIAVFLIFVVMAAQFESPKFSIMVMTTIPFSLIGAFGLLFIVDSPISMVSLLGFLMLIGTVVNNGILYVDTVNQYRQEMELDTALIEAGATRLRPILMTTLTTVVSMLPMCFAFGDAGATTQGLALVNVGGLTAATVLALLMLPVYYAIMTPKKKKALSAWD